MSKQHPLSSSTERLYREDKPGLLGGEAKVCPSPPIVGGIQQSSFEEKWCVIMVSVLQGEF